MRRKNEMQEAVLKIQKLGIPPEGFHKFTNDEAIIQIFDEWVDAVTSIERPITWDEAEILIKCAPIEDMSGVEWTFLHCIESVFKPEIIEEYRNLIGKCTSEMMKPMLLERLSNYEEKHKPGVK